MSEEQITSLLLSLLTHLNGTYNPDERDAEIFFTLAQLKKVQQQMWIHVWLNYLYPTRILEGALLGSFTWFLKQVFNDIKTFQDECKIYYITIFKKFHFNPQQIFNTLSDGMTFSEIKQIQQYNQQRVINVKQKEMMDPYQQTQNSLQQLMLDSKSNPQSDRQLQTLQKPYESQEKIAQKFFDYQQYRMQEQIYNMHSERQNIINSDQLIQLYQLKLIKPEHFKIDDEDLQKLQYQSKSNHHLSQINLISQIHSKINGSQQKAKIEQFANQTTNFSFPYSLIPPPPTDLDQNDEIEKIISESLPSLPRDEDKKNELNEMVYRQEQSRELIDLRNEVEAFRQNSCMSIVIPMKVFGILKAKNLMQVKQSTASFKCQTSKKTKQKRTASLNKDGNDNLNIKQNTSNKQNEPYQNFLL